MKKKQMILNENQYGKTIFFFNEITQVRKKHFHDCQVMLSTGSRSCYRLIVNVHAGDSINI